MAAIFSACWTAFLVGQAGREGPDGGHLLRLLDRLLQPHPLRDVFQRDERPLHLPAEVPHGGPLEVQDHVPPAERPVGEALQRDRPGLPGIDLLQEGGEPLLPQGREGVQEVPAQHLLPLHLVALLQGPVPVGHPPFPVQDDDPVLHRLHDLLDPLPLLREVPVELDHLPPPAPLPLREEAERDPEEPEEGPA
ncbi:MAG: hypothetical protein HYY89_02970 [candidate division NC10 bacterium]|nr:hypothetical protein [candidate division NC10 bacterium]